MTDIILEDKRDRLGSYILVNKTILPSGYTTPDRDMLMMGDRLVDPTDEMMGGHE